MRLTLPLLVALLLVGTAGATVATTQPDDYSMSSPSGVDIPARPLTVDGEDYSVRAVGRVDPGEDVRIDVSAPESAEYSVYLYNRNLRIEQTDATSGSGRATFSTDGLSPGSYLAAVYDGGILDVYPVVVEGYDLSVDAPDAGRGEISVDVAVADGALTGDPPTVQVVLGDDARSVRTDATRTGDGTYRATVPTDGFDPGTYALYGVVRGDQETEGGDRVILAVSDRHEVRVEETAMPTTTPADSGSDGGGGRAGGGDDGTVAVRSAELLNGTVMAGDRAVVRVELANADPVRGERTLHLAANGTSVTEERVAVAASTERTLHVRAALEEPGAYDLSLDGRELGTLVVTERVQTSTATPAPASTATPGSVVTPRPTTAAPGPTTTGGDGAGFGVPVAALAVALAALALGCRGR